MLHRRNKNLNLNGFSFYICISYFFGNNKRLRVTVYLILISPFFPMRERLITSNNIVNYFIHNLSTPEITMNIFFCECVKCIRVCYNKRIRHKHYVVSYFDKWKYWMHTTSKSSLLKIRSFISENLNLFYATVQNIIWCFILKLEISIVP